MQAVLKLVSDRVNTQWTSTRHVLSGCAGVVGGGCGVAGWGLGHMSGDSVA